METPLVLPEMPLRKDGLSPPIKLLVEKMEIPGPPLGNFAVPCAFVPMKFAATVFPPLIRNWIPSELKLLMIKPLTVLLPAVISSPYVEPALAPFNSIPGEHVTKQLAVPSIVTGCVIIGSADVGLIVLTPDPGML